MVFPAGLRAWERKSAIVVVETPQFGTIINTMSAVKKSQKPSRKLIIGFARGFAAPSLLFSHSKIRRDKRFDVSVERAWQDVGRALRGALTEEDRRREQEAATTGAGKGRAKLAAE